jgi:PAS domain S-box-containing protein
MKDSISILLFEGSVPDAELICTQLEKSGVSAEVDRVVTCNDFEHALATGTHDLILSDYTLPEFDGLTALELSIARAPNVPFIFLSARLGEDIAIQALHHGATDYILKQRLDRLAPAIRRALDKSRLRRLQRRSEDAVRASERRFRELADAMPHLVCATDVDGNVTYCNRRAREYGLAPEADLAPAWHICHPDEQQLLQKTWDRCLATFEGASIEYRLRRSVDGTYRWHVAQFVPMRDQSNRVEGWIVAATDVEEQKRREHALRDSEKALLQARETLEQKVQERTEAYAKLSARLLTFQDEERRRIARDLHDGFGQTLVALKTNLDAMHGLSAILSEAKKKELLAQSCELLHNCLTEVRTISYLLHPPLLDESGFAIAARWYVNGFGERSGIQTELYLPHDIGRLPSEVEVVLFRVLQAALSNVHRHSGAKRVDVSLRLARGFVELLVRDYGVGMPEDKVRMFSKGSLDVGVGLAGMRERVRDLNGTLELESDGGTTIRVVLPVPESYSGESVPVSSLSA